MVGQIRKHPELERLEKAYPLGNTALQTMSGMRWQNRMQASDAYFRDYSNRFGWKENQDLLSGFGKLMEKYGTYVAIGYAIAQNFVADTYYRNPDPLVQDKAGNRDLSRILSDVGKSVHQEVDSESKMKDALLDQWWAGFGCVWTSFLQEAYPTGETVDGHPEMEPVKQKILFKRLSPWRCRFDPEGREWDMSDHSYFAYDYHRTLSSLMKDPRLTHEDKCRVMAYYVGGQTHQMWDASQVRYATLTSFKEEDPEYIRIPMRHIWARPEKQIYDQPIGAQFTLTPSAWPEEFADADVFPLRFMAKNREAEDESGLCGFIGLPDIFLIKPHIYQIQKLEALFLAANQHVINTYLAPKGAFGEMEKKQLSEQSVRRFKVVEFDQDAWNKFPTEMRDKLRADDLLQLVKQGELKELHHLEGIRHEMDMIAQIIGQGPADRGGLSASDTATESMGQQRGLERRRSNAIHVNGKHYNAVTKLIFMILKQRQTLPMRYQMTTTFSEKVWAEFNADQLKDLDLHFDYATGSSEPRTREEEFALRERMAGVLLPVFQARGDSRNVMKIAQMLVEPLNVRGVEQMFNDVAHEAIKELTALSYGIANGLIPADDPKVAAKMMELISIAAGELLTEQDMAEVIASSAGAQAPAPEGEGSLPAAPTPGAADYDAAARGSAAAGVGGGMAN